MSASLLQALELLDEPIVELSGARTLDLRRRGAWAVLTGSVEVYFRDHGNETTSDGSVATPGGRMFLTDVSEGGLLLGFGDSPAAEGLEPFAVGLDARLVELSAERVAQLAGRAEASDALDLAFKTWLEGVAQRLQRPRGGGSRPLAPGQSVLLPAGEPAAPVDAAVCWVRPADGRCRLLSRLRAEFGHADLRPVTENVWVEALGSGVRVAVTSTADAARSCELGPALEAASAALLLAVGEAGRTSAQDEALRLRARPSRERTALEATLDSLGRVVEGRARGTPGPGGARGDPLLAACQAIGEQLGITLRRPAEASPGARLREPVQAIAAASRVRSRKVVLRGEWWRKENGPLLAFTTEGARPVALLPAALSRYDLFDPTTGESVRVNRELADTLAAVAYMFMPSLGTQRVTPARLVGLGLRGIHRDLGFVLGLAATVGLLGLVAPIVTKVLLDDIIPQADRPQLPIVAAVLVVFAIVAAAFGLVQSLLLLRVEAKMEMNMEAALMDRLLRLPISFYRRFLAGDLADRANGISAIRNAMTGTALSAILSGIFAVSSLALLLAYDVKLAVLGLVLTALSLSAIVASTVVSVRYQRAVAGHRGRISGILLQMLSAVGKIRVAAAERRAFSVWANDFAKQRSFEYRAGAVENGFQLFHSAFPIITSMAFFGVVYAAAGGGEPGISAGSFVAALAAFSQFMGGMLGVGTTLLSVVQVVPQWERLEPILSAQVETNEHATDPGPLRGAFEVRHVSFRYSEDAPLVLDDVTLEAQAGTMVALVGSSGSGKSTLLRLLLGLERPLTGAIYYDGLDLAGLDLEAVRQQIGVVLQAGRLMQGDIASNIIGHWNLTLEDAWRAARLAGLADDIEAMPMGMHTVVSEGGTTFSGGQRQRLMIARALVHQPKLLLLDEATSALDNRTQRIVTESFERMEVTRLVIAHRLSTIRNADLIYVLESGRVVESGTFNDLLEADGVFTRLARRQMA